MGPIKTAPALSQAITSTYIYDVVIAVAFILVMLVVVNLIKWQSGKNDRSGSKRRTAFFILMAVTLFASLLFDYLVFYRNIAVPAFATKYMMNMVIASVVSSVVYFLAGFTLVKISRIGTKLESIFPKKDR